MMLARFRNRMRMSPINRVKHVVDSSATGTAASTVSVTLALATDTPTLANTVGVETASKVFSIYLRVEVAVKTVEAAAISNCYLLVWKNPGGNLTAPGGQLVGSNDNKKYIIHQEMVMLQNATAGNPRTLFNGVIKIPGQYSRFGPNDLLEARIFAPAVDTIICLQCHYKEFR